MRKKLNLQFPISIYIVIFIYTLIAAYAIYDTVEQLTINEMNFEYLLVTLLLIYLRRRPVHYILKGNQHIELIFIFPITLIYGIVPVIISSFFNLLFPANIKQTIFTKRYFNFMATIASVYIADKTFQFFIGSEFNGTIYNTIVFIILSSLIYSFHLIFSVSLVSYLENKIKPNKLVINIFESNIVNGIITYFLHLSLGVVGVFIAVLYAHLFSRRSLFQVKYYKSNSELYEAEQRLSLIFDTIDYGIILFDQDKQVKMANPVALEFLKKINPEPIGRNLLDFKNAYPPEVYNLIDWSLNRNENFHKKKINITYNQINNFFDIYTYPYKVADGKVEGVILLYKNVTEEQLIRKQLIEADKLSHIGQIAAGKVHEIKNPLTTVKGYLQFLRKRLAKGDTINLNHFEIALQELDRANDLINSLLIMSKQPVSKPEIIELNPILNEVTQLFEHQLIINNITIDKSFESGVYIIGIENHLKQVIINLILNAIDAVSNKETDKQISIKMFENNNEVIVEITDNGIGILPEDIDKLSIPFYTTKELGTGLGLSVSYKLIEEHNGKITVDSKVGKGTTFRIVFPQFIR